MASDTFHAIQSAGRRQRPRGGDIKSRGSRSAGAEPARGPQRIETMARIHSLLGQPLTIPCTNQTHNAFAAAAGEMLPSQPWPARGHNKPHQQQQQQQQRLRGAAGKAVANGQGISLIVWHKDDQLDSPIYSVDARGAGSLREAKQQTGLESLRGRAHLEESTRLDSRGLGSTPALVIDEATGEDGGVYTCTIEFYEAQTQTYQMRVLLINPPRNMIIQDHLSNRKESGPGQLLFGPYDEESRLALTCETEPGEPRAQLTWWQLSSHSSPASQSLASSDQPQLTTLTLSDHHNNNQDNPLERLDSSGSRDYFVALHSGRNNKLAGDSWRPELPFANGHLLRHWRPIKELSSTSDELATGRIRSTLEFASLSRSNFGQEFLCLAQNNHFSTSLNVSLKLDLNLKPLEVRIMNKTSHVFRLGQKITIECRSFGSRPAARIGWSKGAQELESASQDEKLDSILISERTRDNVNSNFTKISYLTFVPQLSDNQQGLTCSASNPRLPNVPPLADHITMNVLFPAQMTLQFGANIRQEQIRLGSDVFMDCLIKSNPPIDDLNWLFNGQALSPNASAGIIMSNLSLVIQSIRIEHRGRYQCVAQNSLGKAYSNKLELRPKFKPICDYALTKTKYKVAVNQPVRVECNVLAEPGDDLEFVWQFNQTFGESRSGDTIVVHPLENLKQYETNFTKSFLTFTPRTRRNYGQLLCSASSISMGKQEQPCVIQVTASEQPEPVFSCFFDNFTNTSFDVHCQSSLQQGSSTRYLLYLYTNESMARDSEYPQPSLPPAPLNHLRQRQQESQGSLEGEPAMSQEPLKSLTSEIPSFKVTGLKPDTSYEVMIYVQNLKGDSVPYIHSASTLAADPGQDPSANGLSEQGQIQFSNHKRAGDESVGLSDRLMAYLRVGDYLQGDTSKPLLAVALVVLLCTITVVTISFFVVRVCGSSSGDTRRASDRRRTAGRSQASSGSKSGLDEAAKSQADKLRPREPQVDKSVQLGLATPSRLKALAGSGSDTSRETNTDSTMVSLFRPAHQVSSLDKQRGRGPSDYGAYPASSGFLQAQEASEVEQQYARSPMVNLSPALLAQVEPAKLYGAAGIGNNSSRADHHLEHIAHTPQISVQSGSDCTSNNELLAADGSEFHDQIVFKCQEEMSEPVYMIERDGQLVAPAAGHCLGQRQVRLLSHAGASAAANFWPNYGAQMSSEDRHNGSVGGGTQVSSSTTTTTTTADNPDQLVCSPSANSPAGAVFSGGGGGGGSSELPIPINFMPNSVSIPVSLAGECPHLAAGNYYHRRLSHELLAQPDLCLASPAHHHFNHQQQQQQQYLTLAMNPSLRYQRSYDCLEQQQQQPLRQLRAVACPQGYGSARRQQHEQLVGPYRLETDALTDDKMGQCGLLHDTYRAGAKTMASLPRAARSNFDDRSQRLSRDEQLD